MSFQRGILCNSYSGYPSIALCCLVFVVCSLLFCLGFFFSLGGMLLFLITHQTAIPISQPCGLSSFVCGGIGKVTHIPWKGLAFAIHLRDSLG